MPVVVQDLFKIQTTLVQKQKQQKSKKSKTTLGGLMNKISKNNNSNNNDSKEESDHIDLKLLQQNCKTIRQIYECQSRAKLYANQIVEDISVQSSLRLNIAMFENENVLSLCVCCVCVCVCFVFLSFVVSKAACNSCVWRLQHGFVYDLCFVFGAMQMLPNYQRTN